MEKEKPPMREQRKIKIDKVAVEFKDTFLRAERIFSAEFNAMTDVEKIELMRQMIVDFALCFRAIFESYGLRLEFGQADHDKISTERRQSDRAVR